MKNRRFRDRLGFALAGWRGGWAREKSFRTQVKLAGLAVAALLVLRPAPAWWALVALTMGAVIALELANSAMEAVIDRLHPEIHPEIGIAKDMLSGAVLVMSVAALVVAVAMAVDAAPKLLREIGW